MVEAGKWARPIRDLGLAIQGTKLEPVIATFEKELEAAGLTRVKPNFYLSTEWGVPFGSVSIAIPFYLASDELTELHAEKHGHIEGATPEDLLRYFRHEMGHVINYAYRLYDREDWVRVFGSITQPYVEDYRPEPFSRRFVLNLPGWYAQKHPDEDWSETFAVWMTPPAGAWRDEYKDWPARSKLEFCDRLMKELIAKDPLVSTADLDEDVRQIGYSIEEFYERPGDIPGTELPRGLDGALKAIFHHGGEKKGSALIRALERQLSADVYLWTGHFPEQTRHLLRALAERMDAMGLGYPASRERAVAVGLTTLITALAMNHVLRGSYAS